MTACLKTPTRPVLRYHGGKWILAPWIISHFPTHRVYTEAFGGAASVLMRKPRSYGEVYNDLDGEIVGLFRILRGERSGELLSLLRLTPFSRVDFLESYEPSDDALEQARRTVVRSFMGFGSGAASGNKTGFRANSNRSGTTPAHDWANLPTSLAAVAERLQGVTLYDTIASLVRSPAVERAVQAEGEGEVPTAVRVAIADSRKRAPLSGYVYAIRNAASGAIKIGFATNPRARFSSIGVSHSEKLELLGVVPGDRTLERSIGIAFGENRIRGEWFRPHRDLHAWVKECLTNA